MKINKGVFMNIKRVNPLSEIYSTQKQNSKNGNQKKKEKEVKSNYSKTFEEILKETENRIKKQNNEMER